MTFRESWRIPPRSDRVAAAGSRGKGCLLTYDMIATVDAQWFSRNATKVFDAAAAKAGVEFHRGMDVVQGHAG